MIEDGLLSVISDFWCNMVKSGFMLVILWACRPIKGLSIQSAREIGIDRRRKKSMLDDEINENPGNNAINQEENLLAYEHSSSSSE